MGLCPCFLFYLECIVNGNFSITVELSLIHIYICFASGMDEMGPVIQKLYDTLTGIQMGRIEGPEGWVRTIL